MKFSKKYILRHPSSVVHIPLALSLKEHTKQYFHELHQMYLLIKDLEKRKIPGVIVETGSWRGGTGVYMAKVSGRKTYLLDSFEGFPELSEKDTRLKKEGKGQGYLKTDKQAVVEICDKVGVTKNVEIIPGFFAKTIPHMREDVETIALLRLDADLYTSTKEVLDMLYDKVAEGGFIVIDDYRDFDGCRNAVYDFFTEKGIAPIIYNSPAEGKAYFLKNER